MKIGYTSSEACRIANITYRQLQYWDKTNLAKPSIIGARGTGTRRIYSFIDLVCLRVTAKLKQEGVSLQKMRKSIAYLNENFPEQDRPLADFVFLTDGDHIFVLTENPGVVLDTLRGGQFVLSLAIGYIIQDTKRKILSLEREEEREGHVFEVIIEPDEDRYHAYCPILRGCRTWGHTEAEALVKDIQEINPVIRVKEAEEKDIA